MDTYGHLWPISTNITIAATASITASTDTIATFATVIIVWGPRAGIKAQP